MKKVFLLLVILLTGCEIIGNVPIDIPLPGDIDTTPVKEPPKPVDGTLAVHFIDVGQGDSTLIALPNGKTILIDCGNTGKGDDVVSHLKNNSISAIDLLIASHADADHIGACDEIMNLISVQEVWENGQGKDTRAYDDLVTEAKKRNYKILTDDSYNLALDSSVDIDVLIPYDDFGAMDDDTNENSIVMKLTYGATSFLLTADCESECEETLTNTEDLDVDVYKVGHHGSRTSSTEDFLAEVTPSVALISAGENNRYGHPHPEAIDRINDYTDNIFSTIEKGTMIVESNGNAITLSDAQGLLLWQKT